MATGAQTTKKLVQLTGKSFSTLDRLERALKQGGRNQVPRGQPGGGRGAAHYSLKHLVHYGLGLAADPISEAPEQVEAFANLQPWMSFPRRNGWSPVRDALVEWSLAVSKLGDRDQTIPGNTLRDALMGLIDWLSRPEGANLRAVLGQDRGRLYLDLVTEDGYEPSAVLGIFERDDDQYNAAFLAHFGVGPPRKLVLNADKTGFEPPDPPLPAPHPPGTIRKTVRIPYAVFEVLADLWADTRAHLDRVAPALPPKRLVKADPETKPPTPCHRGRRR